MNADETDDKISVGDFCSDVKRVLAKTTAINVYGEARNVHLHKQSGHCYFDLRDDAGLIRCCKWAGHAGAFVPVEGKLCVVSGRIDFYCPRGQSQLIVREGSLLNKRGAREQTRADLLERLNAEGTLQRPRRELPFLPKSVCIVTSLNSAAHADMQAGVNARWGEMRVRFVHARVQGGEEAEKDIARAISKAASFAPDVIICARGGGSREDLAAFDSEYVARALLAASAAGCVTVSAIGHESDHVVLDLVADVRCKTPTYAIETVVPLRRALVESLQNVHDNLVAASRRAIDSHAQSLNLIYSRFKQAPTSGISAVRIRAGSLRKSLQTLGRQATSTNRGRLERCRAGLCVKPTIRREKARLRDMRGSVISLAQTSLHTERQRLKLLRDALNASNPQNLMERGYAIALAGDASRTVQCVADATREDVFFLRLKDGAVRVRVLETVEDAA